MSRIIAAIVLAIAGCRSCSNDPPAELAVVVESRRVVEGGTVRAIAVAKDGHGRPILAPEASWSIAGPAEIERGFVRATGEGAIAVTAAIGKLSATASIASVSSSADVVIDRSSSIQKMTGWEVTAQIGQLECDRDLYERSRNEIYDRTIDELGIDRVRLEFRANVENSIDYTKQFLDGAIDFEAWAAHRYGSENDDGDPESAKSGAFQMTEIDHTMEHVVKPLAERLARRGERLHLNACFVAFDADFHRDHPDEYAELVLVVFEHLRAKHGVVPDSLEVILEPDVAGWGPSEVIHAIQAVGPRLEKAGFRPAIIAPSNSDTGAALEFFQAIAGEPEAIRWLTDFSYHRYRGAYAQNLEIIGALPARFGVRTMMLEHIDSDDRVLHDDLEIGHASAWQRFGLAFCAGQDDGTVHYRLAADGVHLSKSSRMFPQYFRRVRLGAVRYFASSSSSELRPLAFDNENGRWIVIVRAESAGRIEIEGLPPGEYSAEYTTETELLRSTAVTFANGVHAVELPAPGIITLY